MTLSEHASAVMFGNWLALVLAADELVVEWEAERWMRGCELEWVSYNRKKEFRGCADIWITEASMRNYKKSGSSCLSWIAVCWLTAAVVELSWTENLTVQTMLVLFFMPGFPVFCLSLQECTCNKASNANWPLCLILFFLMIIKFYLWSPTGVNAELNYV